MATTYGLTPLGFVIKPLSVIQSEINADLQTVFGQNINLGSESVFGQFSGIFAERESLLWELAAAVYASQYPSGAEGTSVDNILALNNLKRDTATATVTNPLPITETNGITLYGLVLFGTPGTTVSKDSIIRTTASPPLSFLLDNPVVIAAPVNAVQTVFFSNTPNVGSFGLTLQDTSGNSLVTPLFPWNSTAQTTQLSFTTTPTTGAYTLTLTQAGAPLTTASLAYNAANTDIQTAIQALAGYSAVTVSGSYTAGFLITWGSIANPALTIATDTTDGTLTEIDSFQAGVNNLLDSTNSNYPFTDVTVTGQFSTSFIFTFGAGTVVGMNPISSAQQIAIILLTPSSNTLQLSTTVTNVSVANAVLGSPAQAVGTATCQTTGPNFVGAGSLTVIGTPIAGWSGVDNQLDCISGQNVEDDTEALVRRSEELNAQANGPLPAIIEKVKLVPNVTTAIGFENVTEAALQELIFSEVPDSGAFQLAILTQSGTTLTTGDINFDATSDDVQTAIQALTGYDVVLVTGSFVSGFTIDFNGSFGGQPQNLFSVPSNSLTMSSNPVTITPSFGRPGKSFEIVVTGGLDSAIAQAIYGSKPGGIQAYGTTVIPVLDQFGNIYQIGFSRPTEVLIYITISMVTDATSNAPLFVPGSVQTIQEDLAAIGNAVPIGGLIIGFGTNGLIGAFNSVQGILSYTLDFGRSPNPSTNTNIQLAPEEAPSFQQANIIVSYT